MLQPSLKEHLTYTDFCIKVVSSGSPLLIIEVKKHEISALFGENDTTAQVLREAHVVLQDKDTQVQKLWFILTNALVWSLGMAKKVDNKIQVTECYQHLIGYKKEAELMPEDTKSLFTPICKLTYNGDMTVHNECGNILCTNELLSLTFPIG